jgi:hypothetical protein
MTRHGRPTATREEPKAIIEPRRNSLDTERRGASRRKLVM